MRSRKWKKAACFLGDFNTKPISEQEATSYGFGGNVTYGRVVFSPNRESGYCDKHYRSETHQISLTHYLDIESSH